MPRRHPALPDGLPLPPLCVLLLPRPLEAFALRDQAEDLLRAPGAVAVEPARISYETLARIPGVVAERLAAGQARRLRLPGVPLAIAMFYPLQYLLARALLAADSGAELWYGATPGAGGSLHEAALARSALTFSTSAIEGALERNRPLFERMEALGIQSGRLGAERLGAPD